MPIESYQSCIHQKKVVCERIENKLEMCFYGKRDNFFNFRTRLKLFWNKFFKYIFKPPKHHLTPSTVVGLSRSCAVPPNICKAKTKTITQFISTFFPTQNFSDNARQRSTSSFTWFVPIIFTQENYLLCILNSYKFTKGLFFFLWIKKFFPENCKSLFYRLLFRFFIKSFNVLKKYWMFSFLS